MKQIRPQFPAKPGKVTGIAHILAATTYSMGGLARLWQETAFRHEVAAFVVSLLALALLGASGLQMLGLVGLFLVLVAVEALNTAIEAIVDRLSPHWEEYAKHAKDLGSLAVMCVLVGAGLYMAAVCIPLLLAQDVPV